MDARCLYLCVVDAFEGARGVGGDEAFGGAKETCEEPHAFVGDSVRAAGAETSGGRDAREERGEPSFSAN
jgi:hypothetical protein